MTMFTVLAMATIVVGLLLAAVFARRTPRCGNRFAGSGDAGIVAWMDGGSGSSDCGSSGGDAGCSDGGGA
jgi:hypothetical protein